MTRVNMVATYRHERTTGERFPVGGLSHFFEPGRACPILCSLEQAERATLDVAHEAYAPLMLEMAVTCFEADLAIRRPPLRSVVV
jgi:hypothetical protein